MCNNPINSGAVQLTSVNLDKTLGNHSLIWRILLKINIKCNLIYYLLLLATYELVFVNFYADWCKFSNMLAPIYDEAAEKVHSKFNQPGRIVMGKVDCDRDSSIASRFHITKYPTLKLFRNGQPAKREYRGQRSSDAFVEFIKNQLEDPIKEFSHISELNNLDGKKRIVIGYFDKKDVPEYSTFRRVATNLKEDCQFYVGFG